RDTAGSLNRSAHATSRPTIVSPRGSSTLSPRYSIWTRCTNIDIASNRAFLQHDLGAVPISSVHASASARRRTRRSRAQFGQPLGRQVDAEHGAATGVVLDVDPTVVLLYDSRAHRETKPGAALAILRRIERVEDLVANLIRHADAGVLDRDCDERLLGLEA